MSHQLSLKECRIKASILLKQVKSDSYDLHFSAISRFKKYVLINDTSLFKRKHALYVLSKEYGYDSWKELKDSLSIANNLVAEVYPNRCFGFTNEWYSDYNSAKSHLESVGGYLFLYKNQFFLTKKEYVETLGLDSRDNNWEKISYEWVKPSNLIGWGSLSNKLINYEKTL